MSNPVFNKDLCVGCGTCVTECDLIHIDHKGKGNIPYLKNKQLCIGCGHCISVCPNNAVTHPYIEMGKSELLPELQLSKKIIEKHKNGECPIFRNSPCIIFIYGPPRDKSHFAPFNPITANAYLMLYAQSLKIESCVIGRVLYDTASLARVLEIPSKYEIYSALASGYSKSKYRKTISRKPKNVIWN